MSERAFVISIFYLAGLVIGGAGLATAVREPAALAIVLGFGIVVYTAVVAVAWSDQK
jgi:hypothetical protein